jgi:hypothetical protein
LVLDPIDTKRTLPFLHRSDRGRVKKKLRAAAGAGPQTVSAVERDRPRSPRSFPSARPMIAVLLRLRHLPSGPAQLLSSGTSAWERSPVARLQTSSALERPRLPHRVPGFPFSQFCARKNRKSTCIVVFDCFLLKSLASCFL